MPQTCDRHKSHTISSAGRVKQSEKCSYIDDLLMPQLVITSDTYILCILQSVHMLYRDIFIPKKHINTPYFLLSFSFLHMLSFFKIVLKDFFFTFAIYHVYIFLLSFRQSLNSFP